MNTKFEKAVRKALVLNSLEEHEKQNFQARMDYNRIGFILQALLPILDRFVESTQTKFALKKAVKDFIRESEKFIKEHHAAYEEHTPVDNEDKEVETRDIYVLTARAYDSIVESLYNDKPNEILSKKHLVDKFLELGGDLEDVSIPFKPINSEK